MQHVRLAFYHFQAGTTQEAITKAQAWLLPIFQQQPGFVAYGVVKTEGDTAVSISVWQTRQQAEAAVQAAGTWVKEHIGPLVESVHHHVGDLSFMAVSGALGA